MTGAKGFAGRHVAKHFTARGADVIGIDREVDLLDPAALARSFREAEPDALLHLAAQSSVAQSYEDPQGTFRINVEGTRNVLEGLAAVRPDGRAVIVTTGQFYAERGTPSVESDPYAPSNPYAWSKLCCDGLAASLGEATELRVVRARPFNHSGPGRPDHFVESSLARQVVEMERGLREPVLAIGNPHSVRDFLDVADVARAYWSLLDAGDLSGAYNVCSGRGWSIAEIAKALLAQSDVAAHVEVKVDDRLWRPTDHAVGSFEKLRAATGWAPERAFEETLADLLNDWRRRPAA